MRSGESISYSFDLIYRVPQGTMLGPILFSLFVNDLKQVMGFCRYHLHVDDLQIYYSGDPLLSSHALEAVNAIWRESLSKYTNGLVLNAKKSQAVFIHSRGRSPSPQTLYFSDEVIPSPSKVRNRDIIFNDSLTWSDQSFTSQNTRLLSLGFFPLVSSGIS